MQLLGDDDEIPMGKRQIFDIVEYSEVSVESLVLGRENVSAKQLFMLARAKVV